MIDSLQNAAKSHGLARSTLYRLLGELERAGMVERPRRGIVSLSPAVGPYASGLRATKDRDGADTAGPRGSE
jgi:DNA-binding IclR family transcriptional regulator